MAAGTVTELQDRARSAYALCEIAPERARSVARAVVAEADDDPLAAVVALRALGLALRSISGPHEAAAALRDAIRIGARHAGARHAMKNTASGSRAGTDEQLARATAEARMTYAAILTDLGRTDAALEQCDLAATVMRGGDAGPLLAQRALVLSRAGRADEALADYRRALPRLRAAGDIGFQCRVHVNRGNVLAYLGRLPAAERDLRTGIALAQSHGLADLGRALHANLGFVLVRRGDIPGALRELDNASIGSQTYRRLTTAQDRAEVLLVAGLPHEARLTLEVLVDDVSSAGFVVDVAEWHLMLAQASLAEGDAASALSYAGLAFGEFRKQSRPRWALLARHMQIRARWAAGERTAKLAAAARDAHAKLSAGGWQVAALHCLLVAGRVELALGRLGAARTDLIHAARARRHGPAHLRAAAWYAEALLRLAGSDGTRGAVAALKAGLRVVDEHAASLGATDLRVNAAGLGTELAEQGVRLAVASGKPRAVLEWVERFRAGALRRRPVRPPSDAKLAADLAELRRVTAALAEATAEGKDSRVLRASQLHLEQAVRRRSRHATGSNGGTRNAARSNELAVEDLLGTLGEYALVEILRLDDAMFAVTGVDGRLRMHELGSYSEALHELESLRFSLHRLARRHGSAASLAAAQASAAHAARSLEQILLRPVRDTVGDRPLVIVPTGQLHALPWPTLPSLRTRPVSVAPSATTWLTATRSAKIAKNRADGDVLLVAGPNLEHAAPEVQALAKLYAKPHVLRGAKATAAAVRRTMDAAELVHIAAHGRFRADNPQFSAIDLADGPLTVYDLEQLRRGPRRLVLSACDSGLSAVHAGDELMGFAAAVFSLGTSTLVASVVPVADDITKALMVELHREMCAGASPAHALATAHERVQADGFVCFGAA